MTVNDLLWIFGLMIGWMGMLLIAPLAAIWLILPVLLGICWLLVRAL